MLYAFIRRKRVVKPMLKKLIAHRKQRRVPIKNLLHQPHQVEEMAAILEESKHAPVDADEEEEKVPAPRKS